LAIPPEAGACPATPPAPGFAPASVAEWLAWNWETSAWRLSIRNDRTSTWRRGIASRSGLAEASSIRRSSSDSRTLNLTFRLGRILSRIVGSSLGSPAQGPPWTVSTIGDGL
jgi:hypothetical protein